MKKALLIIDIQNDYFPGGSHLLYQPEAAGMNAGKLLEYARQKEIEVVHIQHIALNEGADFFLDGMYGSKINDCVQPIEKEKVIVKNYPNGFRGTGLLEYLRQKNIEKLIVCGMMTDVCIDATVRAAMDLGFKTVVVGDACATENRELYGKTIHAKEVHESYLAGFTALGNLYAQVITTEEFLN